MLAAFFLDVPFKAPEELAQFASSRRNAHPEEEGCVTQKFDHVIGNTGGPRGMVHEKGMEPMDSVPLNE